ncbi:MAG: AAC(3) family N-acetyltransferase [Flavobacteriales bacterium]|nr:AAC(3) family N-acetyltransferase [Flavobacteriales bacterium]
MTAFPAIAEWPAVLGVRSGGTVQLMADVTRMGWAYRRAGLRFDANAFLSAFLDAVGPRGNVLVPTFNFDLRSGDAFDVRTTRSISGALANAALDHPAFLRTQHPLHSFAVAGADSARIAASTHKGSFDEGSPFAFLLQKHATLLAIDLPLNDALTFVHYVEQRERVSYRRTRDLRIAYVDAEGRPGERWYELFAKKPGHVNRFDGLEDLLVQAAACRTIGTGGTHTISVDLAKAYDVIEKDIRENAARSIHHFSLKVWCTDSMKSMLRTFGLRTGKERLAHAARTT